MEERMKVLGIDHIQIAAPPGSEEAARGFYGGLLGLEEIPKPAVLVARGGVWFQCGPQQLHIGIEPGFQPARKAHPALLVSGLPDLEQSLVSAGCEPRRGEDLPGIRRLFVSDPFGNRVELMEASGLAEEDEA
jgi:catechol 2,3-dioxygenase-like lactoylglutathione lyase family enzyme